MFHYFLSLKCLFFHPNDRYSQTYHDLGTYSNELTVHVHVEVWQICPWNMYKTEAIT